MPTVRLTETPVCGLYRGDNGCIYTSEEGVERRCSWCGSWAQAVFRWSDQAVCGRHVRVLTRTRIRILTTFACRVLDESGANWPPAVVLRRGDELAVAGSPERVGPFDRFTVPGGHGFVLVPRSRWAWASGTKGR